MNKAKISAVILCAALAGTVFSGCGDNDDSETPPAVQSSAPAQTLSQSNAPESSSPASSQEENQPQQDVIKIKSYSIAKDYSKKDALLITYEWTNTGDKAASFMVSINDSVYQNGVELASAYGVDGADAQKQMNDIKPGITYEISVAYVLQDKSDVSVECTDLFGTETFLEQTISLKDL